MDQGKDLIIDIPTYLDQEKSITIRPPAYLNREKGITIHIPAYFSDATNGQLDAKVNGRTVKECLDELIRQFPRMEDKLYNKRRKGKLINMVEIYVNRKSAYPEELAKNVNNGDEIHITIILACPCIVK